jgi:hypothetical protein
VTTGNLILLTIVATVLLVAYARGADLRRLGEIHFRWLPLLVPGFGMWLVSYLPLALPIRSAAAVLGFALLTTFAGANHTLPGVIAVGVGAASNALVIAANDGAMPQSCASAAIAGRPSCSPLPPLSIEMTENTRLNALGDLIPTPWRSVYSVGDVLVMVGIAVFILTNSRRPRTKARSA